MRNKPSHLMAGLLLAAMPLAHAALNPSQIAILDERIRAVKASPHSSGVDERVLGEVTQVIGSRIETIRASTADSLDKIQSRLQADQDIIDAYQAIIPQLRSMGEAGDDLYSSPEFLRETLPRINKLCCYAYRRPNRAPSMLNTVARSLKTLASQRHKLRLYAPK